MQHRYTLEEYKGMNTRYDCPACGKKKVFTRYIDTETHEHLGTKVGKCSRANKCDYHYTPKQYFQDNPSANNSSSTWKAQAASKTIPKPTPISFIPNGLFTNSLKKYETNCFINFITELFGSEIAKRLIQTYNIGSSKKWHGATVFWQIDIENNIRTGKVMLYNPATGKRVKDPFDHFHWAHKFVLKTNYELMQCLFGEHLLNGNIKTVALVESEKTAIIASVFFPEFIWLATGGLSNLTEDRCKVLKGRKVILFPDIKGFVKWKAKAEKLSLQLPGTKFTVSDLLERNATDTEREKGLDIADYLMRFDYRDFIKPTNERVEEVKEVKIIKKIELPNNHGKMKLTTWEKEINEVEHFFANTELPLGPIKLFHHSTLHDPYRFIKSHLSVIRNYNGNVIFMPYLERLKSLKDIIILNKDSFKAI